MGGQERGLVSEAHLITWVTWSPGMLTDCWGGDVEAAEVLKFYNTIEPVVSRHHEQH